MPTNQTEQPPKSEEVVVVALETPPLPSRDPTPTPELQPGGAELKEGGEATPSTPPTESATQTPPSPTPPEKPKDWRDQRIAQLTAKLKEARAATPTVSSTPIPTSAPMPEAEIERRAAELSAQQRQVDAFSQACQQVADQGRASFGDFDSRINELRQLAGDGDLQQQMIYNQFIAAAIETGEAPKLLYELGGDLNEASRIMALPPFKMAVELTKRAVAKPSSDSTKAPKPITPVGGSRASHSAIDPTDPDRADHLSTAEWMKRRSEQAEKAFRRT